MSSFQRKSEVTLVTSMVFILTGSMMATSVSIDTFASFGEGASAIVALFSLAVAGISAFYVRRVYRPNDLAMKMWETWISDSMWDARHKLALRICGEGHGLPKYPPGSLELRGADLDRFDRIQHFFVDLSILYRRNLVRRTVIDALFKAHLFNSWALIIFVVKQRPGNARNMVKELRDAMDLLCPEQTQCVISKQKRWFWNPS
ncbi:hypothetical protein [Pararobbsia silviterrae]|uniref:hypothetical protein n=1 Tax=Pararobbsia silviterrae TaxID=1792498 RepID=UPI0011C3756D|nr:hypothetical protein [Pararobbsia silviterrae]